MKTKWPGSIAEYFGVIGGSAYDHRAWTWTDCANYQRARADAAIERLELLAAELRNIRDMERYDQDGIWHPMTTSTEMSERAGEALLAIGPIPGDGE